MLWYTVYGRNSYAIDIQFSFIFLEMSSLPGTQRSTCLSVPSDRTGTKGMHAMPGLKLFFYGFCILCIWKTLNSRHNQLYHT